MAYNTKAILVDVNGKPIPQYFNAQQDQYEVLLGQDGAARAILYGPDGNPISDTNKLPVRAADLETLIGALNDSAVTNPANAASVIAALKGLLSVVGKEATLGQILSALAPLATESTLSSLASAVAKETTLAQVLSALGALATETTLGGVKTAVDVLAGTVDTQAGVQKVALSGSSLALRQTIITGAKTVVSTAAEIFAGASRLDNRHAMVVTNTGADIVYIGAVGVTTSNGFPLVPQDTLRIEFDPTSSVGVFACTSGPNVQVRVVEMA